MMPVAAVWGMTTNQTMWSLLIGAIDAALAWRLLRRFRLSLSSRVWLTIFFGAGTILWSETIYGNTWSMPETCSVMFTLAALDEAFGPARPFRLGIYAGLAALSRYELAIAGSDLRNPRNAAGAADARSLLDDSRLRRRRCGIRGTQRGALRKFFRPGGDAHRTQRRRIRAAVPDGEYRDGFFHGSGHRRKIPLLPS